MRAARWCFILFQVVWLNIVLPGHTRGIVTLPGGRTPTASAANEHACCESSSNSPDSPDQTPTPEKRSRCAVCFFAAHMAPPAPVVSALAPLHLIDSLSAPAHVVAPSIDFPLTYLGRGPPNA